ncbi:MAG: hypothetical protein GEV11_27080 [Streptosporangiales bacterium]|nr:hypothetical protein [Streptosporangiales bacterium]
MIIDPPEGAPPQPPPGDQPCAPPPRAIVGSAPGFRSATYTSADARIQFAVSITLSIDNKDPRIEGALRDLPKELHCPAG